MNIRQNQHREDQGGTRKLVAGCICVPLAIGSLLLLSAGLSRVSVNADLERARREWEDVRPQELAVRQIQGATASNSKTLTLLESGVKGHRPNMYTVLQAVQENIPAQMKLYHLSAGVEEDREKETLARALRISGTAPGNLTAIEAKQRLSADTRLDRFCGELRLVSLRRYFEEHWAFALEGRVPEEKAE